MYSVQAIWSKRQIPLTMLSSQIRLGAARLSIRFNPTQHCPLFLKSYTRVAVTQEDIEIRILIKSESEKIFRIITKFVN